MPFFERGVVRAFQSLFPTKQDADDPPAPRGVDTRGLAKPVIDLGRMAHLNRPGFALVGVATSHVGAGTTRDTLTAEDIAVALSLDPELVDVWLLGTSCLVATADVANWSSCGVAVSFNTHPPATNDDQSVQVGLFTTPQTPIVVADGSPALDAIRSQLFPKLLRPSDPNSAVHIASTATGVVASVRVLCECYVVPRGAGPPF